MNYYLVRKLVGIISLFLNILLSGYLLYNHLIQSSISVSNIDIYPDIYLGWLLNLLIYLSTAVLIFWKGGHAKVSLEHINTKEAILIVVSAWMVMIIIGGIPYLINGFSWINSIFESTSGFTTTGATIFRNIEDKPSSLLIWRALTQWLGGMGIIVFFVSIVPSLKKAGTMLFRSEIPGPFKESSTPHVRDTSRFLWISYLVLTGTLILLLILNNMSVVDAVAHAFSTISTAGFSTRNDSLASYSPTIQWIISLFMLLGGTNFMVYMLLFTSDRKKILTDMEGKWYLSFIIIFSLVVGVYLLGTGYQFSTDQPVEEAFRYGFFNIISLITTTGFVNHDYELFPWALQGLLIITLFTGGSAGSTSGGVKFYRIILLFKGISQELKKSISPNLIISIKVAGRNLPNDIILKVFVFISIYLVTVGIGMILFIFSGLDFITAFSAAASCVGNVGPGLGTIGPTENYYHLTDFAKSVAVVLMFLGRLEFFTILCLFHYRFWEDN